MKLDLNLKSQFNKVKDNWLLILILVILFVVISASNSSGVYQTFSKGGLGYDTAYAEEVALARAPGYYPSGDFAPEVEERLITKTGYLTTEVERGEFQEAETDMKNIIEASDGYLLNENVHKYETGWKSYYTGHYTIKVETSKYSNVVSQLKKLGEIKSFSESQVDVTGRHTNLENDLEVERTRLERYQEMYDEATTVSDKLELSDRIFNQERTIKYYENALKNLDQRLDYSTVYLTLNEEQSEYTNIELVKLSEIARVVVNSFNWLIKLFFILVPWAVIAWLANYFYKKRKRRK